MGARSLVICGLLGVAFAAATAAQAPPRTPPFPLQTLTVPSALLPQGCALKAIPAGSRNSGTLTRGAGFVPPSLHPEGTTANPWIGADRRILSWLRQRVEARRPPRMPDAMPFTRSEEAALMLRMADGVVEGYAATYEQASGLEIAVQAVLFKEAPDPDLRYPASTFDLGLVRAMVFGDGGPCAKAIAEYVRTLRAG
jgi:hypothetical protein